MKLILSLFWFVAFASETASAANTKDYVSLTTQADDAWCTARCRQQNCLVGWIATWCKEDTGEPKVKYESVWPFTNPQSNNAWCNTVCPNSNENVCQPRRCIVIGQPNPNGPIYSTRIGTTDEWCYDSCYHNPPSLHCNDYCRAGTRPLPTSPPPTSPPTTPAPSAVPSFVPSNEPSLVPSVMPSMLPSGRPSIVPSATPSSVPSNEPSLVPSVMPSMLPSIGPINGPTAGPAGSNGDPHFKSWIGEHFEFHGQCDLVLAKDSQFADGLGMDVQIRTKLVRHWSYIKSAAIHIGDDILEVQGSSEFEETGVVHYWYNLQYQGKMTTLGGFPVNVHIDEGPRRKHIFEIDLSSKYPGQKIVIDTMKEFVKVNFANASVDAFGNTVGMLGHFKTGMTYARDHKTVLNDFNELGNEWQVLPADDMFFHDISYPQFPQRCILPEDPRGEQRRRLGEGTISVEEAEAACAKSLIDSLDIKDCVYDILATQDLDMVGAF